MAVKRTALAQKKITRQRRLERIKGAAADLTVALDNLSAKYSEGIGWEWVRGPRHNLKILVAYAERFAREG